MFNLVEAEANSLVPTSTDPTLTGINGIGLANGFPNITGFGAENPGINIDGLMPTIENYPLVQSSSGLTDDSTDGEIDLLTGSSIDGAETATLEASATNPNAEDVHRFWDEQTLAHFFTADQAEFEQSLADTTRYRYEGVEFEAPFASVPGAQPVYRFENQTTGTYFYTLQSPDTITNNFPVLENDGIAFYAFSPSEVPPPGAVPVYRFFNEGVSARTGTPVHFYTGTDENRDNVIENFSSFTYEGPGWYAYGIEGAEPEFTDPGNTLSDAFNVGDLTNRTRSFDEFVGSADESDIYRFDLSQNSNFSVLVSGLNDSVNVRLIFDENNDGEIDSGETISSDQGFAESRSSDGEAGFDSDLGIGAYFITVSRGFDESNTRYTIEMTSTPTPPTTSIDPGDSINTVLNVGDITNQSLTFNEFVGNADPVDVYRFDLSQNSDFSTLVSGLNDSVNVQLIFDENNDGEIDSGETISSDQGFAESRSSDGEAGFDSGLGAGTYFITVSRGFDDSNTNYTLSLSASE